MPIIKEVLGIVGEYNGKPKYKKVGVVIEKDGKQWLKMDHLVTPHENGSTVAFFSLFDPKPKEQNAPQSAHQTAKSNGYAPQVNPDGFDDSDVPF